MVVLFATLFTTIGHFTTSVGLLFVATVRSWFLVLLLMCPCDLFLSFMGQFGQLFLVQWFSIDQHFSVKSRVLVGGILDDSQLTVRLLNRVFAVQFILVAVLLAVLRDLALGVLNSVLELVVRFGHVIDDVPMSVLVGDVYFVGGAANRAAELGVRESRLVMLVVFLFNAVLGHGQRQQGSADDGLEGGRADKKMLK